MRIAIIGAGAGIGLAAVHQALEKGHEVVALSTRVHHIPDHDRLRKIQGSATNMADVKNTMSGTDAVLVTVGTKKKKGTTLFSEIAKVLVQSDYKNPVLIITGFGAGDSKPYLSFFMRMVIRLFLKDQYADKTAMEKLITHSKLNWEIVRPGMLGDGDATGQYQVLPALAKGMKVRKINRADVAAYLIREAELQEHVGEWVTLA